jgi:hypothetical protein
MNYPIFLTNLNRLTTTRKMVEDLFRLNGNADIIIIDNASTYPPLLEWYDEIKKDVKLIRHTENRGPWAFFYSGIFSKVESDHYVYSDADLELNPDMPKNWQEIMFEVLHHHNRKASLALRISDLPDNDMKPQILNHQNVCWYETDEPNIYRAITDMTFSMDMKVNGYRYESMRMAANFECKHVPWYLDFDNLPEEEKYYLEHLDGRFVDAVWSRLNKEKLQKHE